MLKAELKRIAPGILGALFDIVAGALNNYEQTEPPTTIRMADAPHWLAAAEPAAGLPAGTFIKALEAVQLLDAGRLEPRLRRIAA